MNILLTASYKNGVFCNGLQQNIIFLANLIKEIGGKPILCIDHEIKDAKDLPKNIDIIHEKYLIDIIHRIDFVLNTSWLIDIKLLKKLKQKNNSFKNIHILYGNSMLADIERCGWNDHVSVNPDHVDEVWISPHYEIAFNYFKTYYKTEKVFTLPYIWSPDYIKQAEKELAKKGKSCFYKPGLEKNIGILEPNLNITKHCLPSIMVIEEYINTFQENSFKDVNVYCSQKLTDKMYFKSLLWNLNITKLNKIFFAPRKKFTEIFSSESNVVVSHQLLNGLNYTYLESLYLNIPLVHNSEYIKSAGYFYPDYNTKKGSAALNEALLYHDNNLEEYSQKSREVIKHYSPQNPKNIEKYKKLLS